ncbi:ATP-binding protein [Nonomuraea solani]|uniref:ATP-binding protein n=1 Tax=Nonomuraea solani TaxID=1144553 RepID=UPI0011AFEA11|nr:ATP-binding protein [Nonomuraea solani]
MASKEAKPYLVDTRLPAEMGSITVARGLARRVLDECDYRGRHEDVLLVVSELVTNALVHGDGSPALRLEGTMTHIRIEVSDSGPALPEPREPGPASGWGLHVVRLLSTGWGISPGERGKVVWCELAARLAPLQVRPSEA